MIRRDYLVVGAGIGGASACEGIRKYDKRSSVTLVGAEAFPPYKRWIISKSFLREKEGNPKKLQEFDERWFEAHKIEARFNTVVTQVNIERRLAVLANGESIEFTKACLAMGSRPVRPAMAGTSLGNVIYLRTIRDALALREMANLEKTIMVVGGGLLACEVAASLRMMKMKVGLMHRDAYLLNRYLDPDTGAWLTDYFAKHGVVLSMGEALNGFEGKTVLRNIQTKSGNRFPGRACRRRMRSRTESRPCAQHSISGSAWVAGHRISRDRGKRNLRHRRSGLLPGQDHGWHAAADALGKCPRARSGSRRQHDGEEAHPLRTSPVLLDRDVRFANGFRRRFHTAAYSRES